MAAIFEQTFV